MRRGRAEKIKRDTGNEVSCFVIWSINSGRMNVVRSGVYLLYIEIFFWVISVNTNKNNNDLMIF